MILDVTGPDGVKVRLAVEAQMGLVPRGVAEPEESAGSLDGKGPWRHLEAVECATLTWVDWFNTRRLLEPIGYVPPAEYCAASTSFAGRVDAAQRRDGRRNVTFPARQYSINGERRSFTLLRPAVETTAQYALRDRILEAYAKCEAAAAVTA